MSHFGFVRVAAATPLVKITDCAVNAERIVALMQRARSEGVEVLLFPELCLTGYTCGDLFHQRRLLDSAIDGLEAVAAATADDFPGVAVVGLPVAVDDQLFNCAAVLQGGKVLGFVPKSYIPNYREFYERRWFAAAATARSREVSLHGHAVPFGTDLLFTATNVNGLVLGVEICEDLWVPIPPSAHLALAGATVLLNPSASDEIIGKVGYRRQLVVNQSSRCLAAYVYAGCGVTESTTDLVFGGHGLIAENGVLLAESKRYERTESLLIADVDLDHLAIDRLRTNTFGECGASEGSGEHRRMAFTLDRDGPPKRLKRKVEAHPFVPTDSGSLRERCEEIFHTQVTGLATRLEHLGRPAVAIGVSGGLDSTLALLVACKTMDVLATPRQRIRALTMPGFGTTERTLGNARKLMQALAVDAAEIDIRGLCLEEMRALEHRPFGIEIGRLTVDELAERLRSVPVDKRHDLVFENVQARMRTNLLMNTGFVVGTGDLSELALGWCTYNGDHMSMYNPNVGIPKTLVRFLVRWAAENEFEGSARQTLLDIVATTISPELLPTGGDGKAVQSTEAVVGPYELHDFFLFHFLRYGDDPAKILYLAERARFDRDYTQAEIARWLRVFLERFFASQFKRSCLPDGPKVGSVCLSPRGDWRMPSDAQGRAWLEGLDARA